MKESYVNELVHETSLYLLQHAHNPVHWYPWGEKALQLAKEQDKPILVSIGYAACHWCHVMERESFEDPQVAAYMNAHFINIKIDREERPDLDQIYMDAVQVITGSGGWPLNVFLTTAAKPFYGGTYFPPRQAFNRASWMDVLQQMSSAWQLRRDEVEAQAASLLQHMGNTVAFFTKPSASPSGEERPKEMPSTMYENIMKQADQAGGGFGAAPKFPQFFSISWLMAYHFFSGDPRALSHALFSLKSILRGGIYDHLGGGMSRYSTDAEWLAPHFEKMLYDNALLVACCSDAYQLTRDTVFEKYIHKTLSFCIAEMKAPGGGFYAALDADSEGEEGKFYVWGQSEVNEALGDEAAMFCDWYDITEKGNWEGKNILRCRHEAQAFATRYKISAIELEEKLNRMEGQLLQLRNSRIRPATDDKILLGWNALMLTAFCKAAAACNDGRYRQEAIELYEFLKANFSQNGSIAFHSYKNGIARHAAMLDDYAFLLEGLLLLQEITGEERYCHDAVSLTEIVFDQFFDSGLGMFYFSSNNQQDVVLRKPDLYDGATASGNSTMANNLMYLAILAGREDWKNIAEGMLKKMTDTAIRYPNSFARWGMGLLWLQWGSTEMVVAGDDVAGVGNEILGIYQPFRVYQASGSQSNWPLLQNKVFGSPADVYICRNFNCHSPVKNISQVRDLLKKRDI